MFNQEYLSLEFVKNLDQGTITFFERAKYKTSQLEHQYDLKIRFENKKKHKIVATLGIEVSKSKEEIIKISSLSYFLDLQKFNKLMVWH